MEGAPLLTIACDELRVWCFAAGTEEEILKRNEEVKCIMETIQSMQYKMYNSIFVPQGPVVQSSIKLNLDYWKHKDC